MTDPEWWACEEPGRLLDAVRGRASDRQLRLFACACARSVWGFVPPGPCRAAVEVSLRYADGQAAADALAAARAAAIPAAARAGAQATAAWAACETANPSALKAARTCAAEAQEQVRRQSPRAAEEEARAQADFLRDIVGDPGRDVRIDPAVRFGGHPIVREIAAGLYADGPREDTAVLADALDDLRCPSPALLEHLRSPGPHVRGCWALDVLLGHEAGAPPEPPPVPRPEPVAPARPAQVAERVLAGGRIWAAHVRQPPQPRPAPPSVVPPFGEPGRAEALREALAHDLGLKKYRRFLRKTMAFSPGPGRVGRLPEWDEFVHRHPELAVREDELVEVCAVCTVHGTRLVERTVPVPPEDPHYAHDPLFLQARGTRFPYAYPAERAGLGPEAERLIWWCPDCQAARAEWAGTAERRSMCQTGGAPK